MATTHCNSFAVQEYGSPRSPQSRQWFAGIEGLTLVADGEKFGLAQRDFEADRPVDQFRDVAAFLPTGLGKEMVTTDGQGLVPGIAGDWLGGQAVQDLHADM